MDGGMIMEDFVPFDLAVRLKDKGFNIPFYFYYRTDDKLLHHANITNPLEYGDKVDDEVIIAPTISQVLKWLREEKGAHITVEIANNGWYYTVYPKVRLKNSKLKIISFENRESYEQAVIAGIEYVLYNLI